LVAGVAGGARAVRRVVFLTVVLALVCAAPAAASDVYVTNALSNSVSQYDVGAGGALAAKRPPTVPAGEDPIGVAVSPNGDSVYVANFNSNTVSQCDVGAGGALAFKSTPTVPAGAGPRGVAVVGPVSAPTSKQQCMDGGFRRFGVFTTEGDCMAFVATRGKNEPGKNVPTPREP
jgi:hypothetical protein